MQVKTIYSCDRVSLREIGYTTAFSVKGHHRISSLTRSIINLGVTIFPSYEIVKPSLFYLNIYRNSCSVILLGFNLKQLIQTRKLTMGLAFKLYSSTFATINLLKDTNVVDFATLFKISQGTGGVAVSHPSVLASMGKFALANSKHLFIGGCSAIFILVMSVQYYRADSDEKRAQMTSPATLLFVASQVGRLTVACIGLAGWQASLLVACVSVGISVANYARFLISNQNSPSVN